MNRLGLILLVVGGGLTLSACTIAPVAPSPTTTNPIAENAANTATADQKGLTMDTSNLPTAIPEFKYEDLQVGTGATAEAGQNISVHYTGVLLNGQIFDSSRLRGRPFTFTLGAGQVIEGWEQGFTGMKVGGRRRLYIPADMAYGSRGAGADIPANADLVFDVELVGVEE